ncbi:diacylglycerol kinase family lipid kinase, partial [Natronoarchaeum mannanilyticum]
MVPTSSDDSPDEDRDLSADNRRAILNPTSGRADHVERVRELAAERVFDVVETERAGHAIELA